MIVGKTKIQDDNNNDNSAGH